MLIAIQIIWSGVICYVKVGPAVVVVIAPGCAQTIIMMGIVHSSLFGNFLEGTIALVVKEQIRFAGHSPRTTLHQHSLEAAKSRIVAEDGKVIDIHVDIARDKKIDFAVAIVIAPGRSRTE